MPPEEAMLQFRKAYAATNQVFDLEVSASQFDIDVAEEIISRSVGNMESLSVGNMVRAFVERGAIAIADVLSIIQGARFYFEFMQELVQSSIEHISQGISVVDQQMRMVAWNKRYLEFFEYPDDYVRTGRPVADLIRFNLERIGCLSEDLDAEVEKRIRYLKEGTPHNFERYRPEGRVLEVSGNPMPGGGFVTSYTDITSHKELERQLRAANETLELRVQQRTRELELAKREAEEANFSKTQFLAAASHDLMQPLNAASLFASALAQKTSEGELQHLSENVVLSLQAADALINSMLEASRLDAGVVAPKLEVFYLKDLFEQLEREFTAMTGDRELNFRVVATDLAVFSDPHLLRRILQNFLSNAVRYTSQGGVLLGCRRRGNVLRIEVWDTGPGIPLDKRREIFQEFRRLKTPEYDKTEKGLGLGLAIAERISRLLSHPINLRSWLRRGSVFSVDVPLGEMPQITPILSSPSAANLTNFAGLHILCVDNELNVLAGMKALLDGWGCVVSIASDEKTALEALRQAIPDLIIADYQLDDGVTGLQLVDALSSAANRKLPVLVITANNTEDIRRLTEEQGYMFMAKPVKPARLRALMSSLLDS
ncbi:MAG TPA: NahK/ErcS family hybrid sensor histidine kinase/response regulator [Pseudomonadales bacterium]|nr:NahK/ErcS family hybrid sensor histidine kinase/response regulator [Pseudomonadales bacterium]